MNLKEQVLEFLEVIGVESNPIQISNGVSFDYSEVRATLHNLNQDGFVIYNQTENTYKIAMDKEYTEGTDMDKNSADWIGEAARTLTPEQFRGAMIFTIGKYLRRMGKKDDISKEVKKVADYSRRWEAYEMELLKK